MYGFLRPAKQYISLESIKIYSQYYCGQCVALHDHFGYASRILTSYDAAFFGLLIAAQQDEATHIDRRRCALFPKKRDVCASNEPSAHLAAALAVHSIMMKIKDKRQEGNSLFAAVQDKILNRAANQAADILVSYGISSTLVKETLEGQKRIEQKKAANLLDYSRPTERFLSEMLRSTSVIAQKPENGATLAKIGTALGRIIYLVDACVDLSDDIVKSEFNAVMAAYSMGGELRQETGDSVTRLIIESLTEIGECVSALKLTRHGEIIRNILLAGLPLMIRQEVSRSVNRLMKYKPALLKYAPHTALISALCLLDADFAYAGFVSVTGKNVNGATLYGYSICADGQTNDLGVCVCLETFVNPCLYIYDHHFGAFICNFIGIILQLPKVAITGGGILGIFGFIFQTVKDAGDQAKLDQKQREQNRIKQEQEDACRDEGKRVQDNAAYLKNTTNDFKKYEQAINAKMADMFGAGYGSTSSIDYLFSKRIQDIILKASAHNKSLTYALSLAVTDGIEKLTKKAKALEIKVKTSCDIQQKLKQVITSVRQQNTVKDTQIENQLKLYEELNSPLEVRSLIGEQRFKDYFTIVKNTIDELSLLVKSDSQLNARQTQTTTDPFGEITGLIDKALAGQLGTVAPTAAATGNQELDLEQETLTARQGDEGDQGRTAKTGVSTQGTWRWRLLAGSLAVVVAAAVVAYLIPSKGKTARRLFNRYQTELDAAYGKNDLEGLKTVYGSMLKEGENAQVGPDNFSDGLSPVWYNELLPGWLAGVRPGALKDFTYYDRIYNYLSQTSTLPEAKGLVEECTQEAAPQATKLQVNGKSYAVNTETIVLSKDNKLLLAGGEVCKELTSMKCVVRYRGEEARVIQITGSRDASISVKKTGESGKVKLLAVDTTDILRQADGAAKDGNLTKALSLYQEVLELAPKQSGLAKKIEKVQEKIRTAEVKAAAKEKAAGEAKAVAEAKAAAEAETIAEAKAVTEAKSAGKKLYKDNGDGTVTDRLTGLMWAAKNKGGLTWSKAQAYCQNYTAGGHSDWRMPTANELADLYDKEIKDWVHHTPLIPAGNLVWTSDSRGTEAAIFSFMDGTQFWNNQSVDYLYSTLPVRGGK